MSNFEVVRSDVEGWDVRRTGEAQALSNYATRELAEEAARKQQDAEDRSGADADAIDIRQDVFSEGPEEDLDARKTILGAGVVMVAVIVLIAVIAIIVATTGFGG
ncbi:MAG: DUF2188 domain-containing protein [Solirubrobacterales bacterium]